MARSYVLHGLRVRSDIELPAPETSTGEPPDVELTAAPGPPDLSAGELISSIDVPAGVWSGRRQDGGYLLALDDAYAFEISTDLRRVRWWVGTGTPGMIPPIFTGHVLTFAMQLQGTAVMHASAVTWEGGALAIAGQSGAGKSTIAGLLCAAGSRIVTDDVLRVDPAGREILCTSGSFTLRLREAAASVADSLPGSVVPTHDLRLGANLEGDVGTYPLRAVVIPKIAAGATSRVHTLNAREAMIALVGMARWIGWLIPEPQQVQFRTMATIAETVPVHELHLEAVESPSVELGHWIAEELRRLA